MDVDEARAVPRPQAPLPPPAAGQLLLAVAALAGSVLAGQLGASVVSVADATLASWWSLVEEAVLATPLLQDPALAFPGGTWTMLAAVGTVATVWAGVLTLVALVTSRVPRAGVIPGTAVLAAMALVVVGAALRLVHVVANLELHPTLGHTVLHLLATPILPMVAVALLRRTQSVPHRPLRHVPLT